MTPTKHYINLTNGLEQLPMIDGWTPWAFCRIQSTTVERKDWFKLFGDLDHDLLMHLALGWRCIIHDRGARRPVSKTVYYAVPVIRHILTCRWYGWCEHDNGQVIGGRGGKTNLRPISDKIWNDLFVHWSPEAGKVRTKIDYYKRFTDPDNPEHGVADLVGYSDATDHDGDYAFYSELAKVQSLRLGQGLVVFD